MELTVIVTKYGVVQARFEKQTSDIKGFRYIQTHQGQSISYAVKYSGWDCECINIVTGESKKYSDDEKK